MKQVSIQQLQGRAHPAQRGFLAFSLIEILVTVGLLSFIILGLMMMFNQTQRAFRSSMTQTDVLESGRIAMDMLTRELEQMAASRQPYTTNFFAEIPPTFSQPLMQALPGNPGSVRTNIVQRFFFLGQQNLDWQAIGYQVLADYKNSGLGALYRFSTNRPLAQVQYAAQDFLNAPRSRFSRIADGVVHFRVVAYGTNGFPIFPNGYQLTTNPQGARGRVANTYNVWDASDPALADQVDYYFVSNALPAYLEIELGILEPNILERFRAIGNGTAATAALQRRYLSNHVSQVHLFRQRVAVRNVDLNAYK